MWPTLLLDGPDRSGTVFLAEDIGDDPYELIGRHPPEVARTLSRGQEEWPERPRRKAR
jgi:hypothetical protein